MYENLSDVEDVIIGYFFTGGIGSHPVLVSSSMDKILETFGDDSMGYVPTSLEDKVPDALICIYDEDTMWRISGINRDLAEDIISKMGSDYMSIQDVEAYEEKENRLKLANEILKMVDEDPFDVNDYGASITIILDPKINTVYWSDVPEDEHESWRPPYREIPIAEMYDSFEDLYLDGISINSLLELMEKSDII